jgi:hypothetical protein
MSDRWGPSVDCDECGQTVSFGHLHYDEESEKNLCDYCLTEISFWPDGPTTFNNETEES